MARTYHEVTVTPRPLTYNKVEIRCDVCNLLIFDDAPDEFANEVLIALNLNECVSVLLRRDYCRDHLPAIWDAICKIIGADPGVSDANEWTDELE